MTFRDRLAQTWWALYERAVYDTDIQLRLDVIKHALSPKRTSMELEILSNYEHIEKNMRIAEQNGVSRAYFDILNLSDPAKPYVIFTDIPQIRSFARDMLDTCDKMVRHYNDQWADARNIDRYPADHPNNFAEWSPNRPAPRR